MIAVRGDKLFAGDCEFVLAASEPGHFPPGKLPGSRILGTLSRRRQVFFGKRVDGPQSAGARIKNTGACTQQIIFFNLGARLMLVDLPGYGHAEHAARGTGSLG